MNNSREASMLRLAYDMARGSKDPSTQIGAILVDSHERVVAAACNEFPYGVKETAERWERPLKYEVIEHAERNAIYEAARHGQCTEGLTMYGTWAACADCARAIIQAGIVKLVRHTEAGERNHATWIGSVSRGDELMLEAGIEIVDYSGKICPPSWLILHNGVRWNP